MKTLFNIFFLLISICYYSQKTTVLDSLDHQRIPYAEFIIDGNSYFSDSLGTIELTKTNQPFIIKKNGFKSKRIFKYSPEIYLQPIYKEIEEVVINNKKDFQYTSKQLNKNTTKLPNDLSIGFSIKGKENNVGKLQEISIPLKRIYNNNTILKIDFYKIENENVGKESLNEKSIFINVQDLVIRKNNKIDLREYNIPITGNILIAIRVIDETGKTEKRITEPSIQFYNTKDKGTLFFYSEYLNSWKTLSKNTNLISISYTISY